MALTAGRPRKRTPTVEWKIVVPVDVAGPVEELLEGRNGKPRYGARSELLEVLLRRWLQEQDLAEVAESDSPSESLPEGDGPPSSGSPFRKDNP